MPKVICHINRFPLRYYRGESMSDVSKELGMRIRQLRAEKHMSQEELAFKAGISAAHLGQIERATKNPTVDTVVKISSALGVSVSSLFSGNISEAPAQSTVVEKINAQLSAMNQAEQKDILRVIRIFRNYRRTG